MAIHPSAIIDSNAELDSSVAISAHVVIGPHVRIGAGCSIGPGVVIEGYTTIGASNIIHAHATIGGIPQDKKYAGEPTELIIGNNNTFRECVTINVGTAQDTGITRVGSDNWIMAYVHIAHDCVIGDRTIMANATQLAGHVHVGDWAILGGMTAVHQYCRIGAHAMTGAGTVLLQDLPPYVMAQGYPATPHGLNSEGLKRRGFSTDDLLWLKRAYRALYRDGLKLDEAQTVIAKLVVDSAASADKVAVFADFIASAGRGFVR
jgi:UDP-N-acetylglucosamine acyltransferase